LELNAFEPIIFRDLLQGERYLARGIDTLTTNCVTGLTVNEAQSDENVQHSAISATILSPYLGYEATTKLVKTSLKTHIAIPELLRRQHQLPDELIKRLFSPAVMTNQEPIPKAAAVGKN